MKKQQILFKKRFALLLTFLFVLPSAANPAVAVVLAYVAQAATYIYQAALAGGLILATYTGHLLNTKPYFASKLDKNSIDLQTPFHNDALLQIICKQIEQKTNCQIDSKIMSELNKAGIHRDYTKMADLLQHISGNGKPQSLNNIFAKSQPTVSKQAQPSILQKFAQERTYPGSSSSAKQIAIPQSSYVDIAGISYTWHKQNEKPRTITHIVMPSHEEEKPISREFQQISAPAKPSHLTSTLQIPHTEAQRSNISQHITQHSINSLEQQSLQDYAKNFWAATWSKIKVGGAVVVTAGAVGACGYQYYTTGNAEYCLKQAKEMFVKQVVGIENKEQSPTPKA